MEIVISTFTNLTCMVHIHAYPELIDERFDVYYKKTLIMIAASKKRLGELIKNTAGIVIIRNIIGTSDEDINSVYRWMDETLSQIVI